MTADSDDAIVTPAMRACIGSTTGPVPLPDPIGSSDVRRGGEAVVHGIVQQALMRALGIRHVADEAHAAQRPHVLVRHARCLELEPAVGIVRVPHAEVGADLGPGALLHGPQH